MNRLIIIILFCFLTVGVAFSQKVSNVDAYQEGKNIVITYSLSEAGMVSAVYCSTDGGRTWGAPLRHVSGDVNKSVSAGSHRVVWDVLSEREHLKGENICFKVEAGNQLFTVNGESFEMVRVEDGNQLFTVNGVSFEMVRVQGGTFTMGATAEQGSDTYDDKKPTHQVTLSSYSIGKTEVTQALWQAVMGSNPSNFKGSNLPVEQVSWEDCQTFIRKLNAITGKNFRLPTEAEWEYAARGGDKSRGYKYSGSNTLSNVAWYYDNSAFKTHPVATKAPNELGIYDMSGNVWEWCSDWYGSYSSSSQYNPTGPNSGSYRVDRGGGWNLSAGLCRVSYRDYSYPSFRRYYLGLRLAL